MHQHRNRLRLRSVPLALAWAGGLWFSSNLPAATPYQPQLVDPLRAPWRWTSFPELDGGQGWICAEAKDRSLWFGSETGVVRYDGIRWDRFTTQEGLPHNKINALCATRDGTVYAGTEVGLCRFSDGKWKRVWPEHGETPFPVRSLLETSDGTVWAGLNHGLLRLAQASLTFYTTRTNQTLIERSMIQARLVLFPEDAIPPNQSWIGIKSLCEDREHAVWAVSDEGVLRLVPQNDASEVVVGRFADADKLASTRWDARIFCSRDNEIWIVGDSPDDGVVRYDGQRWSRFDLSTQFGGDDDNNAIAQTHDGVLWITGFGRLYAYENGKWRCYNTGDFPFPKDRLSLLETTDGVLWIGSRDGETWRLDYSDRCWATYQGLHFQGETPDGTRWFTASDGGVVAHPAKAHDWKRYGPADGLMETVIGLLVTRSGDLWAGGSRLGKAALARFDGTTWEDKHPPAFGYCVGYRSLYEAADGSLWFSAEVSTNVEQNESLGLLRYRRTADGREEWKLFSLGLNVGIAQSAEGRIFVGGLGLRELKGDQPGICSDPPELKRWVDNVYSTRAGVVWVAVGGIGAFRYDGQAWRAYSMKEGLANNVVSTFLELQDGAMLAANPKGISRFDGRQWTPQAFPQQLTIDREGGTLKQSADGAIWINVASREWYQRAGLKMPLAEEEFAKVRTTRYRPDTLPPETRLMVFPDVVAQPGNAYVAWEGSDVWRHTATEKLQFSYRLNQGEWSEYLPAISHYFLKMASGAYTFEVRARDGDFNVDPTPARVDFRVLPPVWRQGWFQGLIGTVLVVLAIMEFRVIRRNYRLRIEVEERKRAQTTVEQQNQALGAQKQELEAQKDRLVAQKERLEQEVTQRKKAELEVEKAHKQLVDASRKAGMADVATGVLHNVGNVLNSVNVSANLIADKTKNSRISSLAKLDDLFSLHTDDLADFVARDAKGRQIPGFVKQLSEHLQQERAEVLGEVASLTRQIDHIKEIVVMQQDYARVSGVVETVDPRQLVEDALRIHGGAYDRHGVKVIREFQELPPVTVDKHKVLQILVNLLSNAKYACDAEAQADKQVWVRTEESDGRWRIVVRDNGVGLAPENLIRVFHQGFSLRKGGHGFGLHSSANAAKEMGGSLVAHSDGPGKGATFVLELPMQPSEEPAKADSFTRPADEHA